MEISSSSTCNIDTESTAIQGLIDTFGSFFSCAEITSAYRNAGRNTDLACQILSFSEPRANGGYPDAFLQKQRPSTSGGKNYRVVSRETLSRDTENVNQNPSQERLNVDEKAIQTRNAEKPIHSETLNSDVEAFMRKILEAGFKLDEDAAREVLDQCGYNMPKEMESSVDLSSDVSITKENSISADTIESKNVGACNPSKINSEEIMQSLFTAPNAVEKVKLTRLPRRQKTRSIALGKLVSSASFDSDDEKPFIPSPSNCDQNVAIADDVNDSYVSLLRARKEYCATMKEYYTSAIAAFMKGDSARADRLMEKGNFYSSKAREVDEESERMIFKTRENSDEKCEMLLDLHSHEPKQALRLLKLHLSSVSTFDVLKVVIERNGEVDCSKGARRKLVCKLLENQNVQWRDGEDGETILVDLNTLV